MDYKIYLLNNDSSIKEIRRFSIREHYNFNLFCQEIKKLFPDLSDGNFVVLWKGNILNVTLLTYSILLPVSYCMIKQLICCNFADNEGDDITVSNDKELSFAIKNMNIGTYKMYIKETSQNQKQEASPPKNETVIHPGIGCDNCNRDVLGYRYKCIQCEDYDLCAQCEAKGLHPHHYMIRMPQPLQWYHSQGLIYCLRKFLKKSNIHSDKKHGSNEHSRRKKKCHEFALNYNVLPWLEAFMPYLNSFIEPKDEPCPSDSAGPSKETPKQKDEQNSKAYVRVYQTDSDDLDVVIEVDSDKPLDCSAHSTEKRQESKEDASSNKNDSNKFPGEGRKLFDDAKDNKASVSDTASIISQDSITKATAADEWTIVDKHGSPEISRASSVLSNLNETVEKQVRYRTKYFEQYKNCYHYGCSCLKRFPLHQHHRQKETCPTRKFTRNYQKKQKYIIQIQQFKQLLSL